MLALVALALAAAWPMQINGWNQNAHYALTRAFVAGTPSIDRSQHEIGDLGTGDVSTHDGRTFSNKAPGLAYLSAPWLAGLEAAGMRTTGDPTRIVWALHLFTLVPAFLLLLLLVRRLGDDVAPGYGLAAAATAGAATLLLPFATLYFSHLAAAALSFGAFFVLWRERRGGSSLRLVAAGGALSGLAVTTEYPAAIAGAVVGLYALARPGALRRGLAYAGGVLAGVLPLLAYNVWAFGSPAHVSYENNSVEPLDGFFGTGAPSPAAIRDLLFSAWGLLTNTPVVACGLVGAALLLRRGSGRRAEAAILVGVPLVSLLYVSTLQFTIFGGQGLPRYLIGTLPFVAVGLAVAWARFPLTTLGLALVSAIPMIATTVTNPLAAYDGDWLGRLWRHDLSYPASSIVGVSGWYATLLVLPLVVVAVVLAARATPWPRFDPRDAIAALAALGIWAGIALAADNQNGRPPGSGYVAAAVLLAAAAVLALSRPMRAAPQATPT